MVSRRDWGKSVHLAVDDAGDLTHFGEQFRKFLGRMDCIPSDSAFSG